MYTVVCECCCVGVVLWICLIVMDRGVVGHRPQAVYIQVILCEAEFVACHLVMYWRLSLCTLHIP